jgi:hypothetical protein
VIFFYFLLKVALVIEDDVIRPGTSGKLGFFCVETVPMTLAPIFLPSGSAKPDPGRGVKQNRFAVSQRKCGKGQIVRGHALQHDCGRGLKVDFIGQASQLRCEDDGIGA